MVGLGGWFWSTGCLLDGLSLRDVLGWFGTGGICLSVCLRVKLDLRLLTCNARSVKL